MRMSQPQGLPQGAINFLEENAIRLNPCSCCKRDDGFEKREIGTTGMYEDTLLFAYKLKDGQEAVEFVQQTIWSSGPMIWMGLRIGNQDFLWTEAEIQEMAE